MIDGGRQLVGQPAANTPVLQGQFQGRRLSLAEGRLVARQRLVEAPGRRQQADLLQGLLALPGAHFQQFRHLPVLRAVRGQAMEIAVQLLGAIQFPGAHGLADRRGEGVEIVRFQQPQARQGVLHQCFAMGGLPQADLLQQPFALLGAVARLRQQRQGHGRQTEQRRQSSHRLASQLGISQPLASNR
ncbi:hypothetical protein FQZ97_966090 [compost metagenome]